MIKTITSLLLASALLTLLLLTPVSNALAYIGPGAGMSVVGSLLSILATIVVAIGAIVFWPLRIFMKRRKARRNAIASADPLNSDTVTNDTVNGDAVNTVADSTPDGN